MALQAISIAQEQTSKIVKNNSFGYRYIIAILIFLGVSIGYIQRVNISIAIVGMLDNSTNPGFETYDWSESEKSYILTSHLWGYTIMQVPGSLLGRKLGPKSFITWSILISSLAAISAPICAYFGGWQAVCVARAITGLSQAAMFSAVHSLLTKWAHFDERGRLVMFCYTGTQFGTVVVLGVSGMIASSRIGWPGIFYLSGISGLVWLVFWIIFCANSPAECKYVSEFEREYIEKSTQQLDDKGDILKPTPLKNILLSLPFLGLISSQSSTVYMDCIFTTEIPTFLSGVYGFNIKSSAIFSAIPYLAMLITAFVFLLINDVIVKRKMLPIIGQRKLFNTISEWIPATTLVLLTFTAEDNGYVALALLTVAVGMTAARCLGVVPNAIDIAPTQVGIIFGIISTTAYIVGQLGPLLVGIIVKDPSNFHQWKVIFWFSAAVAYTGNLIFLIFAKADPIK